MQPQPRPQPMTQPPHEAAPRLTRRRLHPLARHPPLPRPFLSTSSVNQCHSCSQKINKQILGGEPLKACNTFPNRKGKTPQGRETRRAGASVSGCGPAASSLAASTPRLRVQMFGFPGKECERGPAAEPQVRAAWSRLLGAGHGSCRGDKQARHCLRHLSNTVKILLRHKKQVEGGRRKSVTVRGDWQERPCRN